jgi:hypothetical protein
MAVLTNDGEEYIVRNGLSGAAISVGLFDDTTDTISDGDNDPSSVTTEPSNGNYTKQSHTIVGGDIARYGGDWGIQFDVTFDVTNTTGTVDAVFLIINFQPDGEGAASDRLVGTADLSQSRDLSQIDQLDVTVELTLD